MRTHRKPIVGLVLWGALAVARAAASEPNVVRAIDVAERDGAVELAIQGSRAPSYTVFKLQDPPRLVVDLAGADVSKVASPVEVGKAGVVAVSTAQYQDERSAVGRIIVALEGPRRYEVTPRGDAVVVRVLGDDVASATPTAPTATPTPTATASASVRPEPVEGRTESAPAGDDHVVSRRVDEAPASDRAPARAVTAVKVERHAILLATDGPVSRIDILELRDPARLALDLHGVTKAPRAARAGAGFASVRLGKAEDRVRVVLDAAGALPEYEVRRVKGGVVVATGAAAKGTAAAAPPARPERTAAAGSVRPERSGAAESKGAESRGEPATTAPVAPASRVRIADVRFAQKGGAARIEIAGKAPHAVSRPDAHTVVLSIENAELAKKLERSLDTTAFDGPVMMVSSFNQPATGEVKIVATLRGPSKDRVEETARGLAWTFEGGGAAQPGAEETPVIRLSDDETAGFAAEAPSHAVSGAPQARGYTGRRITLDFHDIEIRNLLRLIADVSKKNIVVADDITGKVTVSLRNVPWDQALDLVLRSKGLGKQEMGNVIRIAKFDTIAAEEKARAEAEKARTPLVPLKVRIIPVNYARADDLSPRVKDVLSDRGSVSVDGRTNVLIVKDVPEALVRAEGLVRNLDTEIPQVLIESRIVEATSNFTREVGVQWGGNAGFAQTTGNPTGLQFPNIATATGGAGGGPTIGTASQPNYAVNLPANISQGTGGGIGFVFGSAGGAFNLNLRLTALENKGVVKTISSPRIATIDNKEATIGQGLSIPFSQVSASGVNTVFIEAKLELKVTPHVTADGSILLKIKATNNQPNPQLTGANGQPSISKREAETEVLVKDGETTVIGGIYTRQTSNRKNAIPWLGNIPLLGFFFRSTTDSDDHTELLIFITPQILNRSAAVAAGAVSN